MKIIQDLKKGEGAPGNIYTRRRFITDGDGDDLHINKSQRKQINSNMRDARNLSISGRGGEERSIREYNGTDKEGYILLCRAALQRVCRGACIGTVGRAKPFSIISLVDSIVSPSSVTAERSSEAMAATPSPVSSHTTDPAL
jgi:hypothetical protein